MRTVDFEQFGFVEKNKTNHSILYEINAQHGYGRMLMCSLFPGVDIYYCNYRTSHTFSGTYVLNNFLELSYSYEGVYECELKDHRSIYFGEGELVALCNIFESRKSHFPQHNYKGFSIMFDLYSVKTHLKPIMGEFDIDFNALFDSLMKNGNFLILKCRGELKNILNQIYFANPTTQISYIKLKVLELLHILYHENITQLQYCYNYHDSTTIQKVAHVREHLVAELSKHITIAQLANDHHITQTMLKNCFKDIYGIPPYEYLKKIRMNKAAELLKQSTQTISEIASCVGYSNPSKFSSAFKDFVGMTPREYRKSTSYYNSINLDS